jgi:hypothetical protein
MTTALVGAGMVLLQVFLAIPWLWYLLVTREQYTRWSGELMQSSGRRGMVFFLGGAAILFVVGLAAPFMVFAGLVNDKEWLEASGRYYGALLQLQITVNLFILGFWLLLTFWPKGGAVALAAFHESVRDWMFWVLFGVASLLMFVWIIVPYFTFGEDFLVVKQLGYDTIMLASVVLGTLGASLSISEEIEGRTAITVMSKPVSRQQFMMGKFVGVLVSCLFLFGVLAVVFEQVLMIKHWWDRLETLEQAKETISSVTASKIGIVPTSPMLLSWAANSGTTSQMQDLLRGVAQWISHAGDTLPVLALCFSQVMVLVALAVALATRLPMVVNILIVLAVYFLSHLTPVLMSIAQRASTTTTDRGEVVQTGGTVGRILTFAVGVFDTVLPDLESFNMDPALINDAPPPPDQFLYYVASVTMYGLIYTAIVLIFGLILFEDRDLA